ncbi:MAG: hypothetical protein C4542_08450 [Dehalococcoidia bacterium]|nr:MAG: hypothetical protein C4542_08450 [Dehalococcoidia bacterium]
MRGVDGLLTFNTSLKSEAEVERLLDIVDGKFLFFAFMRAHNIQQSLFALLPRPAAQTRLPGVQAERACPDTAEMVCWGETELAAG